VGRSSGATLATDDDTIQHGICALRAELLWLHTHTHTHTLTHSHIHTDTLTLNHTYLRTHTLSHPPTHTLSHPPTHTLTYALTNSLKHSHSYTYTHSQSHIHTHTQSHILMYTHSYTHPHSHTHSLTPSQTLTQLHLPTLAVTHTLTHTHTHSRSHTNSRSYTHTLTLTLTLTLRILGNSGFLNVLQCYVKRVLPYCSFHSLFVTGTSTCCLQVCVRQHVLKHELESMYVHWAGLSKFVETTSTLAWRVWGRLCKMWTTLLLATFRNRKLASAIYITKGDTRLAAVRKTDRHIHIHARLSVFKMRNMFHVVRETMVPCAILMRFYNLLLLTRVKQDFCLSRKIAVCIWIEPAFEHELERGYTLWYFCNLRQSFQTNN
jgi:hypothetical protein